MVRTGWRAGWPWHRRRFTVRAGQAARLSYEMVFAHVTKSYTAPDPGTGGRGCFFFFFSSSLLIAAPPFSGSVEIQARCWGET